MLDSGLVEIEAAFEKAVVMLEQAADTWNRGAIDFGTYDMTNAEELETLVDVMGDMVESIAGVLARAEKAQAAVEDHVSALLDDYLDRAYKTMRRRK